MTHSSDAQLPAFFGSAKEAGGFNFKPTLPGRGLVTGVKNWFTGAKPQPLPKPAAPTMHAPNVPTNKPLPTNLGNYGPKAPAEPIVNATVVPTPWERVKGFGSGTMNALNAASTPFFMYSMLGGGGEAPPPQSPEGYAGAPQYAGQSYAYDPSQYAMTGHPSDYYRGIFAQGNPLTGLMHEIEARGRARVAEQPKLSGLPSFFG